jgi:phosphoribosylamine--glycine ligase
MRVCVVGSGAREHALATAFARTADVVVVPGNPGISGHSPEGHSITSVATDPEHVAGDLVVVGPEAPLVAGLADRLRGRGIPVFGPGADGARLEGSKAFMKDLARDAGVPTARYGVFDRVDEAEAFLSSIPGPYVIKTDGLAAGKGVLVTPDLAEARADVAAKLSGAAFGDSGRRVVIEEGLSGPEVSLLVCCAGQRAVPLPPAQDFKRAFDGDEGPNTGGMGAYSPVAVAGDAVVGEIMERIVGPSLLRLATLGIDYRGVLYAGCMLTDEGPKLIEYNVRFGDPEAEVVLMRCGGDFTELCLAVANGSSFAAPAVTPDAAVCVVMASAGYPASPRAGDRISGLEKASTVEGVTVFHAGTRLDDDGSVVTAGGRVLAVSALAGDLMSARSKAYEAVDLIDFHGAQFRTDIALAAAALEASGRLMPPSRTDERARTDR